MCVVNGIGMIKFNEFVPIRAERKNPRIDSCVNAGTEFYEKCAN
jgi:hypothetical protein